MKNTTLDDIAAEIGFSAAVALAVQRGGSNVYIPSHPTSRTVLARIVGISAATRLAACWGGEVLAVPTLRVYEVAVLRTAIGRMSTAGLPAFEIAHRVGLTERRVQQVRRELRKLGLLTTRRTRRARRAHSGEDASQGCREPARATWAV
jgi:hypothetical protein